MKRALLISLFAAIVLLLFPSVAPVSHAQQDVKHDADFAGITFTFGDSIASGVQGQVVPEQRSGPEAAFWMAHPQYAMFKLTGYKAAQSFEPVLYVFPVKSSYMYLYPGEVRDFWLDSVNDLRA